MSETLDPIIKRRRLDSPNDDEVTFRVRVKEDCEESDPSKEKSKNRWFLVRFKQTLKVPFNAVKSSMVVGCLNTAIKNSMITNMFAFGRSPFMFYFKPDQQAQLLPQFMKRHLNEALMPLLGLRQSIRLTTQNEFLLVADFGIRWAYNEATNGHPPAPFKMLDVKKGEQKGVLAGVVVSNVRECIPVEERNAIENALKQRTFHVRYYKGDVWVKQQQAKKGLDPEDLKKIEQRKIFEKRNQRVWKVPHGSSDECIVWNPALYTFAYDDEQVSVCEYFKRRYGLVLEYPKMPLVRVPGRCMEIKEFYPVELLSQGELFFSSRRGCLPSSSS